MQCYLSLKREYSMAEYLFTVSDKKLRSTLTRYRLSGHKLMIETGRHRQTWLPPEQRLCSHFDLNQMETELHFLTECSKYTDIRTVFYVLKYSRSIPHLQLFQTRRNCICSENTRPAVCLLLNMCLSVTIEEKTLRLP